MKRKAQAWSFDLIIGTSIFLIGFFIAGFYLINNQKEDSNFKRMEYDANLISDLVLSEGYPSGWNSTTVITPGILTDSLINSTKLQRLESLLNDDYPKARSLLNTKGNFYISLSPPVIIDGLLIESMGQKNTNQKNLVKLERVSVLDGKIITIIFYTWN